MGAAQADHGAHRVVGAPADELRDLGPAVAPLAVVPEQLLVLLQQVGRGRRGRRGTREASGLWLARTVAGQGNVCGRRRRAVRHEDGA
jgi:hypothetical protein